MIAHAETNKQTGCWLLRMPFTCAKVYRLEDVVGATSASETFALWK